jgi:hypothetical protein
VHIVSRTDACRGGTIADACYMRDPAGFSKHARLSLPAAKGAGAPPIASLPGLGTSGSTTSRAAEFCSLTDAATISVAADAAATAAVGQLRRRDRGEPRGCSHR